MSTQADKPEPEMSKDLPHGHERSPEQSSLGPSSGLSDRAAKLEAISRMIRAGQYHIPAAVIAERMLERLADKGRHQTS